ncbi:Asp-tRNA(Asn)/Glu-tRNA(Gln) amidotransferase subunit GatA [Candidatus Falkowbacteria bacterium]|nr:Asp-tRNA(Asn)/Glu-tRNA(Gln) amidotransferase subunit GatA [Candidatus Falkowbacteria bacterium]
MKLNELTIAEAQTKLEAGEVTSVELTEACLARIEEVDGEVKACLTVAADEALAAARAADERRASGETGPLLGIPFLCKDNIMTAGIKTTAASKILENYIAPYDATIVVRLKEAGAVLLGKTNLDEFAHGASTENSAFGTTHNPYDLERVPGGSSGGSAAAVAADMCLFALGTDTGGSIRCPASFCGITGLKPTYGRSSRFGLVAMTSSTDVPGPMTKTAEDAAIVEQVIAGLDRYDATTVDRPVPEYRDELSSPLKGKKIGLPKEYFTDGIEPEVSVAVKEAIEEYKKLGAEVVEVSLPHTKYGVPVYYIITPSEVSSNLARHDGIRYGYSTHANENSLDKVYTNSRGQGFGQEAKRRIMLGTYALSAGYFDAYYLQAQKVRTKIKEEFDKVLAEVDFLLTPTSPHPAFKIGEQAADPLKMYLEDIFVTGASLAGLPALAIPCGTAHGLPVGLQLIGRAFEESTLLSAAHHYQQATAWHKNKPKL